MIKCNVCNKFKACEAPCKGQVESINCTEPLNFFRDGHCSINGGLCYKHGDCTIENCKVFQRAYRLISTATVKSFEQSLEFKLDSAMKDAISQHIAIGVYIVDAKNGVMHPTMPLADLVMNDLVKLTGSAFFDHVETSIKGGNLPKTLNDRYVCVEVII